ncbi:MAG: hypothetical protein DRN20_01990, partial [Thermoplasmata archaeon]
MVATVLSFPAFGQAGGNGGYLEITQGSGTTTMFGGGEYVYVKFGDRAMFGVVYGVEGHENSIVIFAKGTRYLCRVNVYDDKGNTISINRTVKMWTVFGQRLEDIVEYEDSNGNGVCDHIGWVGGGLYLTAEKV